MLKKVFLQTQFGSVHPWAHEYIENFRSLAKDGWYLKIFTPNGYSNMPENVEICSMTLADFDKLVKEKTGQEPENFFSAETGNPDKFVSDYYPAYGLIFEEYIKGFDYWGHTNWDVVYGDLSKFLPDSELQKYDIWADDVNAINGVFTLYKNNKEVNNLFRNIAGWQKMFTEHKLFGVDELEMTKVAQNIEKYGHFVFGYPHPYFLHSHDRFIQHTPEPKLNRTLDGKLYELFEDTITHQVSGKEIMYFHFSRTKKYPKI